MNSSIDAAAKTPAANRPGLEPLRLLHVISHAAGGGAEVQLSHLARALTQKGHDTHIAFLRTEPDEHLPGVTYHPLGGRRNHDPRLVWDLLRIVRRVRPHVVQTWTPQMDVLIAPVAMGTNTPWVLREASCEPAWTTSWKNHLRRWLARKARAIVANSGGGCDFWARTCPGVPRYLIPNGLPLDPIESVRPSPRAGMAPSERDRLRILYAGRLVPLKNVASLLEAVALLRQTTPAHLVVCGNGPQRRDLEHLAGKLNIAEHVQFLGPVGPDTVWGHMKRAAVFVNLSRFEGCPNAVQEAMACRCSLLLSDIPAHRELAGPDAAVFVDASFPPAIARALKRILGDPDAARNRADTAWRAVAVFSIETTGEKYENLYRQVVAGRGDGVDPSSSG